MQSSGPTPDRAAPPPVPVGPMQPAGPVEPPPTRWQFPSGAQAVTAAARSIGGVRADGEVAGGEVAGGEVIGVGADLEPGTILAAYRAGLFPMPARRGVMAWWSPEPRGILPLEDLRVSRSLRKACGRFDIRTDTAFGEVIAACADRRRPGAWIDGRVRTAYIRLWDLGWAHSVEAWQDGRLVGGLYGLGIGGLFAGESMFHRVTDASKVALVALVERLSAGGATLLDVQWATDHLRSLGAIEVSRARYHELLVEALAAPALVAW